MENARKPTPEQIAAARGRRVRDVIADQLDVLFCGINPSLYSAAVGHHFARPGNRFWPALAAAGITPRKFSASEETQLCDLGYGITNIVPKATARADELNDDQLRRGMKTLKRKIRRRQIGCVAFLGITAYRIALSRSDAPVGPQSELLAGAKIWLLPNPSGLNAHYQLDDFARLFAELHAAIRRPS